ncbi:MAG: LysM peptidoglycan-binding domain-containing protein, partial [Patescibacteria group bacterium]
MVPFKGKEKLGLRCEKSVIFQHFLAHRPKLLYKIRLILGNLQRPQPQNSGKGKISLFSKTFERKLIFVGLILALGFTIYKTAYADVLATSDVLSDPNTWQSAQVMNSQKMAVLEASDATLYTGRGGSILVEDNSTLVPTTGPLGATAGATAFVPANDQISVYVVKEGDVLSQIAGMFGVSINTIMWANDIKKSTDISEGDVLVILPISGVRHTVKKGDTISKLAKLYNADAGEIARYNGLDEGFTLAPGEEIIVPHGEIPAPKPTKRSSSGSSGKTGSLPAYSGYYIRPLSGGTKTQGIHGNNGVDIAA